MSLLAEKPRSAVDVFALFVATAAGAGFVPVAPGTAGTVMAVPIYWALWHYDAPRWVELLVLVVLTLVGMACAERVGKRYFHAADAGQIVIDEVVGFLLTVFAVPFSWTAAVVGFAGGVVPLNTKLAFDLQLAAVRLSTCSGQSEWRLHPRHPPPGGASRLADRGVEREG